MASASNSGGQLKLVRISGQLQPLGKNQAMKLMLEKDDTRRDLRGLWISFCGYCNTAFSTAFSKGISTDGK
jgi:hypothetical protein